MRILRRRLFDGGLRRCIATKKPQVLKKKLKHISFAKELAKSLYEFWKSIFWSDEPKFNLFGSNGMNYLCSSSPKQGTAPSLYSKNHQARYRKYYSLV